MKVKFVKRAILFLLSPLLLCAASCLDDPVGEDYYNNIDLIKGKTRPQAPCIEINTDSSCEYTAYFNVGCLKDLNSTPTPDDESDDTCVYTVEECETDSDGDELGYYLYYSSTDPEGITDFDYYSVYYLWNEAYLGVPNLNNVAQSTGDGTFYFWANSWDGGRLSNHSDVIPVTFPFAVDCPSK